MIPIWCVYANPSDARGWFVARRFDGADPTAETIESRELGGVRLLLAAKGLMPMRRNPYDDPTIVEVWL
jgi:hypothetical protein